MSDGTWLSLAAGVLVPLPALLLRIAVEEEVLAAKRGEPHADHESRTKRLIPGIG